MAVGEMKMVKGGKLKTWKQIFFTDFINILFCFMNCVVSLVLLIVLVHRRAGTSYGRQREKEIMNKEDKMKKRGCRGGRCEDLRGESSTALYSMCRSSNNVISDSRGMVQYDMAWYSAVHECWYKICEVQAAVVMKVNSYS